jgi:REP element-mobilizing transposase RayT
MPQAWNNWYHVTVHAYGAWLRGDPRGWRTQNHREHVEGDYRNPPSPGTFEKLHARSLSLMKRAPVKFSPHLRGVVLNSLTEKLREDGVEILAACLDGSHVHLLGRFNDHRPKHWVGRAKKHASHVIRSEKLRDESGGLWGRFSFAKPIVDRRHQLQCFRYIQGHGAHGAVVWTFRDAKKF